MLVTTALYRFLANEAKLTQASLESGLNEISSATLHVIEVGRFYSGAFQLSIALERVMKLTLVLKALSENNLTLPEPKAKKIKDKGHKILSMHESLRSIKRTDEFFKEGTDEFETLEILHDFAMGDRYYNITNLPSADTKSRNPIVDSDFKDPLQRITNHMEEIWISSLSDQEQLNEEFKFANFDNDRLHDWAIHPTKGGYESLPTIVMFTDRVMNGKYVFIEHILKAFSHVVKILRHYVFKCFEIDPPEQDKPENIPFLHEFFPHIYVTSDDIRKKTNWSLTIT